MLLSLSDVIGISTNMSICESEENRKKLAWLVPGYILLAWFFCVLFQPLSIRSPSSSSSSSGLLRRHGLLSPSPLDAHYKVIYLNPDGAAAPVSEQTKPSTNFTFQKFISLHTGR